MTDSPADGSALADTNVVVYAYDPSDAVKLGTAKSLLRQLSDQGRLVLSVQVLNEFCSVMMRPSRTPPLEPDRVAEILRSLAATGEVIPTCAVLLMRPTITP